MLSLARVSAFTASLSAFAQWPTTFVPPAERTIEPLFDLPIPDARWLRLAEFSPDHRTIYALVTGTEFNAWALAVRYWPEALGALTTLIALALSVWVIRVLRRRRRRAEFHCRRCNYCLTGLSSPRECATRACQCPECAADLARRRPILGVPTLRRLALPLILLAIVAGAYASMRAAGLPRGGRAERWLCVPAPWLGVWVASRDATLAQAVTQPWQRMLVVDTATGAIQRVLWERHALLAGEVTDFRLAPDGRTIVFLAGTSLGELTLEQRDISGGALLARTTLHGPSPAPTYLGDHGIVGFSPDGAEVFVPFSDAARAKTGVLAWSPAGGRHRILVEEDALVWEPPTGNLRFAECRRFCLVPGGAQPRFLSAPSLREQETEGKYVVRVHEGSRTREFLVMNEDPTGQRWGQPMKNVPLLTPDGSALVCSTARRIWTVDLWDGEPQESYASLDIEAPLFQSAEFAIEPEGRLLFIAGRAPGIITVRHAQILQPLGALNTPAALSAMCVRVSSDGCRLLVVANARGSPGQPGAPHLLCYDVTPTRQWWTTQPDRTHGELPIPALP